MTSKERESWLWIVTGACLGLVFLNYACSTRRWTPGARRATASPRWKRRSAAAGRCWTARRSSATTGRRCCGPICRRTIRRRDNDALKAINRWRSDSAVILTSVTPQRQTREDAGYDAFEYRLTATGDQVAVGRFLYDLGTDPMPCSLGGV